MKKETQTSYQQLPHWYWTRGLHDAKVLSVTETELIPDWRDQPPRKNQLDIYLDSSAAILERDIRKIALFNYKVKTPEIPFSEIENTWWLRDTLEILSDHRYLLEINFETGGGKRKRFAVQFKTAEIERG